MNLFSPILRWFGLGGLSNKETGPQVPAIGDSSTDAGISVTDERGMQVSSVWACVQYITNSICSLPLEFYEKTNEGRQPLPPRHYLNELFHISPNALMKPRDFRKAMTMQLCAWSNAYAEIVWNGDEDRPLALIPLRPGRMTPFIDENGELTYHYQTDNGVAVYAKKSIMHLKGFGSDGIVGFDRLQFARKSLGLSVSADVYASKQFAHGGRSGGGNVFYDRWLTDEQRAQAKKLYGNLSETAYRKGQMVIWEGGLKYEADQVNPDTMQMIETRKMQLGEIARFFGVPEVLIGAATGSTAAWPASFEAQLLFFLTFTLQDYLDEWEAGIRDSLLVGQDKQKIIADHDTTGFIKMDSKSKAELHSKWVQNGIKSRNEIRRINMDPPSDDPGADALTVQVNLTPIGDLETVGATPETPPE